MHLKLGFDATSAVMQNRTGIENYVHQLVRRLATFESDDLEVCFYLHAGNPYVSADYLREALDSFRTRKRSYRLHAARRGYGLALSAFLAQDRLDLVHLPRYSRPWRVPCPSVVTVYDVKAVGLSEEGRRIEKADLTPREQQAILKASGVIAISASTLQDLRTCFGNSLKMPLRVVHLGVDDAFYAGPDQAEPVRCKYDLESYILFVGTLQYRKNLERVIAAFAEVKRRTRLPHKLVLAGRDGWGAELVYAAVAAAGLEREVVFPGYVAQADLPGLYAAADLFVYPSLHEGFGLPLLEAMASGTPVLTSRAYSIPEVAGDAAVYVDPLDMTSLTEGLRLALQDKTLRETLVRRGAARAAAFSWETTVRQTVAFYRELCT